MEPFNQNLAVSVDRYIEALFAPEDEALIENRGASQAAGLPDIAVSPNQGKLLYLIAKLAGARRILEIGTLGGYSTTWLARALPAEGTLVSLECEPVHARVAHQNLERAAVSAQVQIRVGPAGESLRAMIAAREKPFDLIFIDAEKPGYPGYLLQSVELSRPGTVILADNVIRNGLVMEESPADENARGARAFNAALAAHAGLESIVLPIIRDKFDGMSISIVK